MRQTMLTMDSYYSFPGYRLIGYPCHTNKPCTSVLRGAGVPQGLAIMEHIMTDVAMATGVTQRQVRACV